MTAMEKKLSGAVTGLVVDMIKEFPRFKRPLKRVKVVLDEMAGSESDG